MITYLQEIIAVQIGLDKINNFFPGIQYQLSINEPKVLGPGEAHDNGAIQALIDEVHGALTLAQLEVKYFGLTQKLYLTVHVTCTKQDAENIEWGDVISRLVSHIRRVSAAQLQDLNPTRWLGNPSLDIDLVEGSEQVIPDKPLPVPADPQWGNPAVEQDLS